VAFMPPAPVPEPGVSTLSRVSGLDEGAVSELKAQGLGAFGVVDHFLAQEGDEVEAGRAVGLASPAGQGLIGWRTFGAEGSQRGQEQSAVGGHHEGGCLGTASMFHNWACPTPRVSFSSRWLTSICQRSK